MQFDGITWPPYRGIQDGEYKLQRIHSAMLHLNNTHLQLKNVIHIAGTNGKGSVSSFLQNVLLKNGYSCGLYTSPHLVKINERIKINGIDISDDKLLSYTKDVYLQLKNADLHNTLTFFEGMTVIAFYIFAKESVDFNIIEVGLGGRWDATNILQNPLLSIITSISLDHQDYLGNTIEHIAKEKFEIIKPHSNAILGINSSVIHNAFLEKCESVGASGIICNDIMLFGNNFDGTYQAQNATLATKALEFIEEKLQIKLKNIQSIICNTKWRGRLQRVFIPHIQKDVTVDCGHNIGGISAFLEYISKQQGTNKALIFGMLKRKDRSQIVQILHHALKNNTIAKIICTNFEGEECVLSEILCEEISHHNCIFTQNLHNAFTEAQNYEIFCCGSIYMIGKILEIAVE